MAPPVPTSSCCGAHLIPGETADRPGFVALVHGTVEGLRASPAVGTGVERINYDTALNGRLLVEGASAPTPSPSTMSVTITLDGGAGDDDFRIGQIFERLDAAAGQGPRGRVPAAHCHNLRGYLSLHQRPLVALGGAGEDEFTVYSNQAELRLEGEDGNDLFVVRAFALAQTNPDGTIMTGASAVPRSPRSAPRQHGRSTSARVRRRGRGPVHDERARLDRRRRPRTRSASAWSSSTTSSSRPPRSTAPASTSATRRSSPSRSTASRAMTSSSCSSTPFGVSYRVIGGLGSDTINVAGDISTDIAVRDIEGASGAVDHLVTSGEIYATTGSS